MSEKVHQWRIRSRKGGEQQLEEELEDDTTEYVLPSGSIDDIEDINY